MKYAFLFLVIMLVHPHQTCAAEEKKIFHNRSNPWPHSHTPYMLFRKICLGETHLNLELVRRRIELFYNEQVKMDSDMVLVQDLCKNMPFINFERLARRIADFEAEGINATGKIVTYYEKHPETNILIQTATFKLHDNNTTFDYTNKEVDWEWYDRPEPIQRLPYTEPAPIPPLEQLISDKSPIMRSTIRHRHKHSYQE